MTNRLEYSLMVLAVAGLGFYALYDPLVQREQWSSEKLASTRDGGTTVPDWARGLNDLGVMYLNGRGVQPDLAAAFAFFSAAAEGGDPLAMNNLGWIYQNGLGLEADQKKAKELYARAAQIFNKLASSNSLTLAKRVTVLTRSAGVSSPKTAIPSASTNRPAVAPSAVSPTSPTDPKSVDKEGARGLNELGIRLLKGTGVERDLDAAFSFFSLAAQQGDRSAMNNLGTMYENGWGTESNRRSAIELYAKAAQLDNQLARENLQRLRSTISELDGPTLSRPPGRANASIVEINGGAADLSPGKPNVKSIPQRDEVRRQLDMARTPTASSLDSGWSTGAIPLASSDTDRASELKRRH